MKCACKKCEAEVHQNTAVELDGNLYCCECCASGHEDPEDCHCRLETCECGGHLLAQ